MQLIIPQYVMLKLNAFRDMGDTEVTGFFITEKNSPLKVIDAILIKAACSIVTVDIAPESITDMFMEQTKKSIYPDQLMIWWHTHPGLSAAPSSQDMETFKSLGKDRALNIMYILAGNGNEFAQAQITDKASGLHMEKEMTVVHPSTGWSSFPDYADLAKEYKSCVTLRVFHVQKTSWYNPPVYKTADDAFDNLVDLVDCGTLTVDDADQLYASEGNEAGAFKELYEQLEIEFAHSMMGDHRYGTAL